MHDCRLARCLLASCKPVRYYYRLRLWRLGCPVAGSPLTRLRSETGLAVSTLEKPRLTSRRNTLRLNSVCPYFQRCHITAAPHHPPHRTTQSHDTSHTYKHDGSTSLRRTKQDHTSRHDRTLHTSHRHAHHHQHTPPMRETRPEIFRTRTPESHPSRPAPSHVTSAPAATAAVRARRRESSRPAISCCHLPSSGRYTRVKAAPPPRPPTCSCSRWWSPEGRGSGALAPPPTPASWRRATATARARAASRAARARG